MSIHEEFFNRATKPTWKSVNNLSPSLPPAQKREKRTSKTEENRNVGLLSPHLTPISKEEKTKNTCTAAGEVVEVRRKRRHLCSNLNGPTSQFGMTLRSVSKTFSNRGCA